jgi:hypothetical protein
MNSGNAAVSSITRELSAYIAGALKKPLPKDVAEMGKHHLLDTLAAIVSGSRLLPGRRAIIETVWRIEKVADIRALRPLLRA